MPKELFFDLSPTQSAFVHSDAHIVVLRGPMGEGKTYAAVTAMIRHAQRCGQDIRAAILRDTHQNIKSFTVPDIKKMLGQWVSFHDDYRKMIIHTTPSVEADLIGVADEAALAKFQGAQWSLAWIEEPAPVLERANAGVPYEVFKMAVARAARQEGGIPRVQISQNPADEDHWTEDLALAPRVYARDPVTGQEIILEVFNIKPRENTHLSGLARAANIAAFQDDDGKKKRYLEGKAAPVQRGKKVTPSYNPDTHYANDELPIIPGGQGFRMWDGWHNPVCVIGQFLPPGRIWFHDVLIGQQCGVDALIADQVLPLLSTLKYRDKIDQWRDIGDPTMRTPDQSSRNKSAARVIEALLKTRFEPGPSRWPQRINPLQHALRSSCADGSQKIMISRAAIPLHRALNGGWHWKTDNNGVIAGSTPVKDDHSHIGDAVSHGVPVLLPYEGPRQQHAPRRPSEDDIRIALSYGPSRQLAR